MWAAHECWVSGRLISDVVSGVRVWGRPQVMWHVLCLLRRRSNRRHARTRSHVLHHGQSVEHIKDLKWRWKHKHTSDLCTINEPRTFESQGRTWLLSWQTKRQIMVSKTTRCYVKKSSRWLRKLDVRFKHLFIGCWNEIYIVNIGLNSN